MASAVEEVGDAAELDVEGDGPRHVADRELAVERPVFIGAVHPGRAERHRRPAGDVEQLGRTDVRVAVGYARVDRGEGDRRLYGGVSQGCADRQPGVDVAEAAAH